MRGRDVSVVGWKVRRSATLHIYILYALRISVRELRTCVQREQERSDAPRVDPRRPNDEG